MNPPEVVMEPPDLLPPHTGDLIDAFDSECRLLAELARVLVAQREGVSSDDLDQLDASVFAAHRVLRTLQQARERRRTLLQLMGAPADLTPRELDGFMGPGMPPELASARDRLLESADGLARELTVNRRVLDGAMAVGERLIQLFVGTEGGGETYAPDAEPKKGGGSGSLLNTKV